MIERPLSTRSILGSGIAVGLAIALSTLDPGFISGSSRYWALPEDDPAQHLAGLLAFARDRWHFPLLAIEGLGDPEGANAANLDVIPLVAVFVKLLYPLTGRAFLYLGLWVALSRVLQPVLAAMLLAELGERRPAPILAVSLLAGGLPSLLERGRHEALSSQFLLLAGFLLYLRLVRAPSLRKPAAAGAALLAAALLVHPYLLAMLCPLYLAGLAERWRRGRLSAPGALGVIAAQASALFLLMAVCGHLDAVERPGTELDIWSLNLLTPILWHDSRLLPAGKILADAHRLLAPDGTSYLGLGVLGLLGIALMIAPGALLSPLRRHPLLCGALASLTAFSISNRIFFAHTLLLSYPLPIPLANLARIFPITARFFWPVALALVVWLVARLSSRLAAPTAAAVLALACAVQGVDLSRAWAGSYEYTRHDVADALGSGRPAWVALAARHRVIETFPSYACSDPAVENEFDLQLQLIAVRAGASINSAYLARPNKDCGREAEQERRALHEPIPPGTLRVFYRHPDGAAPDKAGDPTSCRPFERGVVCTQAWADPASAPWAPLLLQGRRRDRTSGGPDASQ